MSKDDEMASCTSGLQKLHVRPQAILGESSKLDEVFLSDKSGDGTDQNYFYSVLDSAAAHTFSYSVNNTEDDQLEDEPVGRSGPSCYQLSLTSVVLISIICLLLIACRTYIRALLLWLENADIVVCSIIFFILFTIVSFPMAWGYILLMLAAGYLYGLIYGPLIVIMFGTVGILIAHVVMKYCCRSCIMKRFYNDKIEAVIRVVESEQGFKVIALARLTPIPFGLQNGLFALTDIPLLKYCSASAIGLSPTTILNCYMGTTVRSMEDVLSDESQTTGYIIFIVQ
ncbi:hypothetical protein KUTeg_018999, partial [Tegillarca granosa]